MAPSRFGPPQHILRAQEFILLRALDVQNLLVDLAHVGAKTRQKALFKLAQSRAFNDFAGIFVNELLHLRQSRVGVISIKVHYLLHGIQLGNTPR